MRRGVRRGVGGIVLNSNRTIGHLIEAGRRVELTITYAANDHEIFKIARPVSHLGAAVGTVPPAIAALQQQRSARDALCLFLIGHADLYIYVHYEDHG